MSDTKIKIMAIKKRSRPAQPTDSVSVVFHFDQLILCYCITALLFLFFITQSWNCWASTCCNLSHTSFPKPSICDGLLQRWRFKWKSFISFLLFASTSWAICFLWRINVEISFTLDLYCSGFPLPSAAYAIGKLMIRPRLGVICYSTGKRVPGLLSAFPRGC